MCLCAGAVFMENRYWWGPAPTHWRLKLQVSKNKQHWLLFTATGPNGGKSYQLFDTILLFPISLQTRTKSTHTHMHSHIRLHFSGPNQNWINLNRLNLLHGQVNGFILSSTFWPRCYLMSDLCDEGSFEGMDGVSDPHMDGWREIETAETLVCLHC